MTIEMDKLREENKRLQGQGIALGRKVRMLERASFNIQALLQTINRSNAVMESLTILIAVLTLLILITGLYPIVQQMKICGGNECSAGTNILMAGLDALLIFFILVGIVILARELIKPQPPKK